MAKTNGYKSNYCKLMSVDDEPMVHDMIADMIKSSELPVVLVGQTTSSLDAKNLIKEIRPDILLLDINMPDISGLELAERINSYQNYKPIIIFLTAYDVFDYAKKAVSIGAVEYVLKPIIRAELIKALSKAINIFETNKLKSLEIESLRKTASINLVDINPALESRVQVIVKEVKDYIEEHYFEPITLESASNIMKLSSSYLGPLFKSGCGISFRAFLRGVRILKAKELLKDPQLNLGEIAEAVGYDDINYFSQVFLAETGVRPGEYRGMGKKWAK